MMHLSNFLRVAEYIDFPPQEYFKFSRAADPVVPLEGFDLSDPPRSGEDLGRIPPIRD
jgi:hypothetical protein